MVSLEELRVSLMWGEMYEYLTVIDTRGSEEERQRIYAELMVPVSFLHRLFKQLGQSPDLLSSSQDLVYVIEFIIQEFPGCLLVKDKMFLTPIHYARTQLMASRNGNENGYKLFQMMIQSAFEVIYIPDRFESNMIHTITAELDIHSKASRHVLLCLARHWRAIREVINSNDNNIIESGLFRNSIVPFLSTPVTMQNYIGDNPLHILITKRTDRIRIEGQSLVGNRSNSLWLEYFYLLCQCAPLSVMQQKNIHNHSVISLAHAASCFQLIIELRPTDCMGADLMI